MAAENNPISFEDLFNFNDLSTIQKGVDGITTLKKSYTDFYDTVIAGQFARLTQQELTLAETNDQLLKSTLALSVGNKANQQALLDNLKAAEQLKAQMDALKKSREDATKTDQAAGNAVKSLSQQYAELKKQYEAALAAGDTQKMDEIATKARAIDASIKQMNTTLKSTKEVFQAAAGSYAALDAENKKLLIDLKQMPDAFNKNNVAANELKAKIAANTSQLKEFDGQIGQSFRNVGNYKSALGNLGGQFSQFAIGYLSIQAAFQALSAVVSNNIAISDSLVLVRQKAGETADEVNDLEEALKKIDTRTSLKDLTDIAGIGAKRGVDKSDLAAFTEDLDKVNLALNGQIEGGAEGVATALAKINSLFGITKQLGVPQALKQTGAALVELGQHGITTSENIADFATRTAAVAKIFQLTLPQVLAYGSAFQEAGFDAERGGTAFNKLLIALATRKDKFFAIAQLADANLTVKSFTDLINNDANAALQKFFAGLTSGGATATDIAGRLKDLGLKAGNLTGAVIGLAENQPKLQEELKRSDDAFKNSNAVLDQAAIKNDTLGASVDKLEKTFSNATTSGRIAAFFKGIIDGLTDAGSYFDKLTNSQSWREFFDRFLSLSKQNSAQGLSFDNKYDVINNGTKVTNQAATTLYETKSRADNGLATNDPATQKIVNDQLKTNKQTLNEILTIYDKLKQQKKDTGSLSPTDQDTLDEASNYIYRLTVLNSQLGQYVVHVKQAQAAGSPTKNSGSLGEVPDNKLESTKDINARISELKNDALAHPEDKADDVARIEKLKAELKSLGGVAANTKDGFALLTEEVDKLAAKIQDRVVKGEQIAQNDPMVLLLEQKRAELYAAQKAYEALFTSKPYFPAPPQGTDAQNAALEAEGTKEVTAAQPGADAKQAKIDNVNNVESLEKQLDQQAIAYDKYNTKILALYKNRTITQQQYDELAAASSKNEQEVDFFLTKSLLEARLKLYSSGSKEYIAILKQIADLDKQNGEQQIADAKKVEAARIASINAIFDAFSKAIPSLTKTLGSGYGEVFKTLTKTVQQFAIDQKLTLSNAFEAAGGLAQGFTDVFNDASNARITQLGVERDQSIALAGNNSAAKAAIEKQYNKEVAAEKTKQAKADKLNAMFQIALGTAEAIAKSLPDIPLSIAIGILGAAELALVAAKPIPQFEKGRKGGRKMIARINERGPEALEKNGKFRFAGGGKDTITELQENESVHTAEETKRMFGLEKLGSNQFFESIIKGTGIVRAHEEAFNAKLINAVAHNSMTPKALEGAMSRAMDKQTRHETIIDERGFQEFLTAQNLRILQQNRRRKRGGEG